MRYFTLLGFQHVILFFFPGLVFIVLLYTALSRTHFHRRDSEERKKRVVHVYPEGIEVRNSPFPLVSTLIIIGFLLWAIFYTLGIGILGVKI